MHEQEWKRAVRKGMERRVVGLRASWWHRRARDSLIEKVGWVEVWGEGTAQGRRGCASDSLKSTAIFACRQ